MNNKIIARFKAFVISIILCISSLHVAGCQKAVSPVTKTGVYFDTVISITLYDKSSSEMIDDCFDIADRYEKLLSKTLAGSDVYNVNSANTKWVQIDKETYSLIQSSLIYEDLSEGRFSVMCGALTDLWDISGKSSLEYDSENKAINPVPSEEEIDVAKSLCGNDKIDFDDASHSVRINTEGARLDLGAVAKGYIADKMKEYLVSKGVNSGIIQLGGNVLLIGENPVKDDGYYHIGITKPFADESSEGSVITAVSEKNTSVVTSGNYQRYFKYNDKIYHHIIDLKTGYPSDNGLNSVSIITDSSFEADALSTVVFLLGKESGEKLINSLNGKSGKLIKAIFIDSNNNIIE